MASYIQGNEVNLFKMKGKRGCYQRARRTMLPVCQPGTSHHITSAGRTTALERVLLNKEVKDRIY